MDNAMKFLHAFGVSWMKFQVNLVTISCQKEGRTFDHNSISISPTVVSSITRPLVGRAMDDVGGRREFRVGAGPPQAATKEGTSHVPRQQRENSAQPPDAYLWSRHHASNRSPTLFTKDPKVAGSTASLLELFGMKL